MLAVPGAVWAGAVYEELFVACDPSLCGDRARGWFLAIMVTAPLIPLGGWQVARGLRPGLLARLGRLATLFACGVFVLLGVALVAGGVGASVDYVERNYGVNLDDPEGSRRQALIDVGLWAAAALWCFAVACFLVLVRRRLPRRYPSESWPPGDRSTSAG